MDPKVSFGSRIPPDRKPNTRLLTQAQAGKLLRFPTQAFPYSSGNSVPMEKSRAERRVRSGLPRLGFLYPMTRGSRTEVPGPSRADSQESGTARLPGAGRGHSVRARAPRTCDTRPVTPGHSPRPPSPARGAPSSPGKAPRSRPAGCPSGPRGGLCAGVRAPGRRDWRREGWRRRL